MLVTSRYKLAQNLFSGYLSNKSTQFGSGNITVVKRVSVEAGLYKPSLLLTQHHLILSALCNTVPYTVYRAHGKRQKFSAALVAQLRGNRVWLFIDKFLNEVIQFIPELPTPKLLKSLASSNISFKVRQKIGYYDDFYQLVEPLMHDTFKGIFIPLSINLQLLNTLNSFGNSETYLRMCRFPFSFYKRKARPAFDDRVSFSV